MNKQQPQPVILRYAILARKRVLTGEEIETMLDELRAERGYELEPLPPEPLRHGWLSTVVILAAIGTIACVFAYLGFLASGLR
jgi:hypothetical protein